MPILGVRDRSRDYVAFMECDAGDKWMPEVDSQLGAWLREKGFDVDLSASEDHELGTSRLSVRRVASGEGVDLHVRLIEDAGKRGTYTTELVAHDEPGARDWISIDVGHSLGTFVKVPRVARYLMQVLPLRDSTLEFVDKPKILAESDVDALMAVLADEARHGLIFVAGSNAVDGIDLGPYADKVGQWARQVYGLAQVVVLDPWATSAFNARAGKPLEAPAWSIRTYHPGVRFDEPFDGRRHRILGTARLGIQSDDAIQYLLGEIARQQAATRRPDPSLVRVTRRFARLENRRLVELVQAAPEAPAAIGEHEAIEAPMIEVAADQRLTEALGQLELVRRVLGLKVITEQVLHHVQARLSRRETEDSALTALKIRVEELQADRDRFEDENRELGKALEEAQEEAEVARLYLDDHEGKIRWLESRLKNEGDYEAAYLEVPEEYRTLRPSDFGELLDRVEHLEGISFTGDVSEVERLNQVDTNGAALRTAWDALLALCDYVRARRDGAWSGGLDQYLSATPSGYCGFPPGKFGETETTVTMQQFGSERVFPVPTHVDPSGRITMKAHFKLARIGMASPRMYIHDGHPAESMVYIGYLGTHLTNTHTN